MRAKRRTIPGALKAKVAIEALVGDHTINEIASENQVHATQVVQWKKQIKEEAVEFFGDRRGGKLCWPVARGLLMLSPYTAIMTDLAVL